MLPSNSHTKPDMYMTVPSVQKLASGLSCTRVLRPSHKADARAGVLARSSHMCSIGAHMCIPGIPRQTWLRLVNGALQPPVAFVHDLPAERAA